MKQKTHLFLCIICLFFALLLSISKERITEEEMASRIAPEILRFHVLANSNSKEDQNLKLRVRTELLNTIYEEIGENTSLNETKKYVNSHKEELEKKAETYMNSLGYYYPAHMELTTSYFPTKAYGDMVFPCGIYEAVKVTIGEGKGRNWWCVLYPPLCFVDSSYAIVPNASKALLRESLEPSDYLRLKKENTKMHLKLKLSEFFINQENKL